MLEVNSIQRWTFGSGQEMKLIRRRADDLSLARPFKAGNNYGSLFTRRLATR